MYDNYEEYTGDSQTMSTPQVEAQAAEQVAQQDEEESETNTAISSLDQLM